MLYLITNRHIIRKGSFYNVIIEALRGGVDAVILREKDLSTDILLPMAYKLRNLTNAYGAGLIVNSNTYVSKAVNADFYHTGISTLNSSSLYGGPFGLSTHSVSEVKEAEKLGASYVLLSHIYKTDCKKGLRPRGTGLITDAIAETSIPIIGLGGIDENNLCDVIESGAKGIAVMSCIMSSTDPYKSALKLKNRLSLFKN